MLLDEAMGVLTTIQNDPMVYQLRNELIIKKHQFTEIWMAAQTLVIAQGLARLHEGKAIQTEIEDLYRWEQLLETRMQPWAKEALHISQNLDNALKILKQT